MLKKVSKTVMLVLGTEMRSALYGKYRENTENRNVGHRWEHLCGTETKKKKRETERDLLQSENRVDKKRYQLQLKYVSKM
jgi:hypothetical protein